MKALLKLIIQFIQIGAFSIGGGYAIIPIIQEQVVDKQGWITLLEFTDIITISQMTPGPLVVNLSTFVGIRYAGFLGAIGATVGAVLIGFIVSIMLYNFFKRHNDLQMISEVLKVLRAVSIGLIASSAMTIILLAFFNHESISLSTFDYKALFIFLGCLFLIRKYKVNPILITILAGIIGAILY